MDFLLPIIFVGILHSNVVSIEGLSFAKYYGSSMVLQHGPARAGVWGYANLTQVGQTVTVSLEAERDGSSNFIPFVAKVPVENGVWNILLPARPASTTSYKLTAAIGGDMVVLTDLLFGQVWLCSGQSNMAMPVIQCFNGTEELEGASTYETIRIFKVGLTTATTPQNDLADGFQEWTQVNDTTLRGFSALCWSYGRKLYELHNMPVGLVESSWGGTFIESWSRPEALQECDDLADPLNPNEPSVLWNAMIHPLLKMTITGAIWYQGEANAITVGTSRDYDCTFPTMIRDWRSQFKIGTNGQTEDEFPFGFVQIAGHSKNWNLVDNYPFLRWMQTASKGSVPNDQMPRTFMAVAMDLPDFDSPYESIHPRDKTTISDRLILGYRRIILGEEIDSSSLLPTAYRYDPMSETLDIQYDNKKTLLEVKNKQGFEICCSETIDDPCMPLDTRWTPAPINKFDKTSVTLKTDLCNAEHVLGHRYAWKTNPCAYKNCALYTARYSLPIPVYIKLEIVLADGIWHKIVF